MGVAGATGGRLGRLPWEGDRSQVPWGRGVQGTGNLRSGGGGQRPAHTSLPGVVLMWDLGTEG